MYIYKAFRGKQTAPFGLAKRRGLRLETACIALQYGLFRGVKWPASVCAWRSAGCKVGTQDCAMVSKVYNHEAGGGVRQLWSEPVGDVGRLLYAAFNVVGQGGEEVDARDAFHLVDGVNVVAFGAVARLVLVDEADSLGRAFGA